MNPPPAESPAAQRAEGNLLDLLGELIDLPTARRYQRLAEMRLSAAERETLERWLTASPDDSSVPPGAPQEVLALLGASSQESQPRAKSKSAGSPLATQPPAELREGPGSEVGRFRLVRQMGRGETGVVFLGQPLSSSDDRGVAIKIFIPPLDAEGVIRRLREAAPRLAALGHPGIATFLECGLTESGLPYIASQWTDGTPILDFCDSNGLPPHQRLALFVRVCDAVQFAHERQIIHGRIKSSNILVELEGDAPKPVVTDMGIAACLETPRDLFIKYGRWPAAMESLLPDSATSRADTYSLGVLLYELLTGVGPIDVRQWRSELFDQASRLIRQLPPTPPSQRLASAAKTLMEMGQDQAAVRDGVEALKLAQVLQGELDRIVLWCLQGNQSRRYSSPAAISRDLQRYLKGGQPTLFQRFQQIAGAVVARWRSQGNP